MFDGTGEIESLTTRQTVEPEAQLVLIVKPAEQDGAVLVSSVSIAGCYKPGVCFIQL